MAVICPVHIRLDETVYLLSEERERPGQIECDKRTNKRAGSRARSCGAEVVRNTSVIEGVELAKMADEGPSDSVRAEANALLQTFNTSH